ncbi:MAG: GspH/FimT family pseudopilin [bacterium]
MRLLHSADEQGFTLIELLIVGAVMAILASVSIPAIRSYSESTGLRGEAKQMVSDIWQARQRAIASATNYSVSFDTDDNSYTVFKDDGAGIPENAANGAIDTGEEVIGTRTLEGSRMLYDVDLDPDNAIVFAPRGMLESGTTGGYVCLGDEDSRHHTIYIRPSGLCRSESGCPD